MVARTLAVLAIATATACIVGEEGDSGPGAVSLGLDRQYGILYAAGVNNADFGDNAPPGSPASQRTADTRAALEAWIGAEIERGTLDPGFAAPRATMIGNRGTTIPAGPLGLWDHEAIASIAGELGRYRRDGISNILVVSHSNGVISAQQGYVRFIRELAGTGTQMCIQFHHTQAAGSELGDFVPLEARYFDGRHGINATFRFTYNREDWMTYDPYRLSPVGRRESAPWIERVAVLAAGTAEQQINSADRDAGGGRGHDQIQTLYDLGTSSVLAGYQLEHGGLTAPCH